jgi:hypothetical protein
MRLDRAAGCRIQDILSAALPMNEVDRGVRCTFRNDFFAMLRSWHNLPKPRHFTPRFPSRVYRSV